MLDNIKGIVFGGADKALLHNNANKASERIPVMKNMIAGEVAKHFAKEMLPQEVYNNHTEGYIHFHDMDENPLLPFFNCSLIDLKGMLENGFQMGNARIETPKSIQTAAAITSQVIAQVACCQYGGVSINRIDEVLEPYVKKSYLKHLSVGRQWFEGDEGKAVTYATEMTHKEVDDACQALEYEVNTLFTSQGQSPFITFGFGLGTSWYARSIQKGILKVRIKGLGKEGRTAIFPKLVYMLDEGINMKQGDPNYNIKKLAISCAAKRNYPDALSMPKLKETGAGCTPMGKL
ncbi:anaerobic ribonucleoside-triphosphate reductase [Vibrio phage 1.084.O._10N.261.49.F5]|nr:anaerobic ribonucleoside-triphosphate reductase [Vibrio phage 1.084.O._10N.261.49.F5]